MNIQLKTYMLLVLLITSCAPAQVYSGWFSWFKAPMTTMTRTRYTVAAVAAVVAAMYIYRKYFKEDLHSKLPSYVLEASISQKQQLCLDALLSGDIVRAYNYIKEGIMPSGKAIKNIEAESKLLLARLIFIKYKHASENKLLFSAAAVAEVKKILDKGELTPEYYNQNKLAEVEQLLIQHGVNF